MAYRGIAKTLGWKIEPLAFRNLETELQLNMRRDGDSVPLASLHEALTDLQAGDDRNWIDLVRHVEGPCRRMPPSNPYDGEWEDLSLSESDEVVDDLIDAARWLRSDLNALSNRLVRRWDIDSDAVDLVFRNIANTIGSSAPATTPLVGAIDFDWRVLPAPSALEPLIDMAMFMPTPPQTDRVVLLSTRFTRLASIDKQRASRLPLAVAHELYGHAAQFDQLQRAGVTTRASSLDREMLEGRAILAERGLRSLGEDERRLHQLYRAKRLLPLVRHAAPQLWNQRVEQIEKAWPCFFSLPATEVFRHSLGSHSRGLARAERLVAAHSTSGLAMHRLNAQLVSPWVPTVQG